MGPTWLARGLARGLAPSGRALHVFGVSYMARGYHRMLAALGRGLDVRVYTLNPCREFWEDGRFVITDLGGDNGV